MDTAPIRIMIVDDHEMVRRGLTLFLRDYDDLLLVGEAANGQEACQLASEVIPDVILMDIVMPVMGGMEAARLIHAQHPQIRIIMLTSSGESQHVSEAFQAGTVGYLMKNVSDDQLAEAIRAVFQGQNVLSQEVTHALHTPPASHAPPEATLTERELAILRLIAEGANNQEIAEILFLSRSTVKYHIRNIFLKLDVENRAEAISVALKNNLV